MFDSINVNSFTQLLSGWTHPALIALLPRPKIYLGGTLPMTSVLAAFTPCTITKRIAQIRALLSVMTSNICLPNLHSDCLSDHTFSHLLGWQAVCLDALCLPRTLVASSSSFCSG